MRQNEETQDLDQVGNIDPILYELSKKIDSYYILELIRKIPNDQSLGKEIRSYYLKIKND